MISTFQALAVTVLALLPGAMFTWKLEQQTGPGDSESQTDCCGSSAAQPSSTLSPLR